MSLVQIINSMLIRTISIIAEALTKLKDIESYDIEKAVIDNSITVLNSNYAALNTYNNRSKPYLTQYLYLNKLDHNDSNINNVPYLMPVTAQATPGALVPAAGKQLLTVSFTISDNITTTFKVNLYLYSDTNNSNGPIPVTVVPVGGDYRSYTLSALLDANTWVNCRICPQRYNIEDSSTSMVYFNNVSAKIESGVTMETEPI